MKPRMVAVLLLSHAGLFLLGGWLKGGAEESAGPRSSGSEPVVPAVSTPPSAVIESPNPILRASGADFRAAWDEMLTGPRSENGEPHGNSLSFFIDWCAVDPDGAVRGLARLRAPRFARNYLSNATNYHGPELAPALVKHWRELRHLPDYKVEHAISRALNSLAMEDPAAAATLLHDLPPGTRRETYSSLFDRLDSAKIERLVQGMPRLDSAAGEENARLWSAVASAVDRADHQHGLWDWLVRTDDPVARRTFAEEGMNKARRAEDWTGFFDAVERLDPAARVEVRKAVFQSGAGDRPEVRAAISEECRRLGLDDWLAEPAGE